MSTMPCHVKYFHNYKSKSYGRDSEEIHTYRNWDNINTSLASLCCVFVDDPKTYYYLHV